MIAGLNPPIDGLEDFSMESRAIATPWSRIVRGLGLGQYPIGYDQHAEKCIRHSIDQLCFRVDNVDSYSRFASAIIDLILQKTNPALNLSTNKTDSLVSTVVGEIHNISNPYFRVTAGCILLTSIAKLNISRAYVSGSSLDLPAEILTSMDEIKPDRIQDENQGRHGDYERISAWATVFFAFGLLGLNERLVTTERDYIAEALSSLERVPSPFFRGRGGSMLISSIVLLGHKNRLLDHGHDHIGSILSYLDRAPELNSKPSFPSHMSDHFIKAYPLLTMLNAIGIAELPMYLTLGRDRLREANDLIVAIKPVERTHMGLYYIIALYNLGCIDTALPDKNYFIERLVNEWKNIDPGRDYFLYGISYSYLLQLAYSTGRCDLITDAMIDRMVTAFASLERTDMSRANRPYPFSYVLNVLADLGVADRLYRPHPFYCGRSPFSWVMEHMSPKGEAERPRLYMINHALINWALRMRSPRVKSARKSTYCIDTKCTQA
ncbi:hypothetical protein [Modicisalibacter radicis]|uniref:hypothetical protein n=1 Tax=Halomonas sp. EAR18 TaxID=2518972 RepID=UPI001B34AF07|nr:hypothetical protein [Halomonas sp. EAR18]